MRKSKAIGLLKIQIKKIKDPLISREEWISSTAIILSRIFPLSSTCKITQIESLETMPEFYHDISSDKRIETDKKKAETFLNNYIEEIELLGPETSSKMEMFFGSFRFLTILITVCSLSFIGGNSLAAEEDFESQQTSSIQIYSLNQELMLQKKEIDSLKKVVQKLIIDL